MKSMNFDEIENVSGAMTENQCVAATSLGFGALGGGIGMIGGPFGGWAGFEGGALIGGIVGGIGCGFFVQ
jgi:hypothetical protein